ncbi:unnamed protein product [Caenorhabditis auriculariae]|uniref:Uncharacterized protein n=1 Tax=Caenorhabditis auriculariae TaxID=2777116 RepID=A0A8S1HI49_9PELO|nr:unnamed protein product [Caenorhabditis auriculariae]
MMRGYDYESDDSNSSGDGFIQQDPQQNRCPSVSDPTSSSEGYFHGGNYENGRQVGLVFNPKPHVVKIIKSHTGFGFNVKGQVSEGGQLRSINGELYAPLQHVSAVLPGGAAEKAGLRKGDRLLQVNGENVEGATHRQVVELIKNGGDQLTMIAISMQEYEVDRYEIGEESSVSSYRYDYSESRSLPVTIPSYHNINDSIERYVVYDLHMAGRHLGSRRYSEFVDLHSALKKEFIDFVFPKLPGKWPFHLSEQQLDSRRRGLEQYLERVCSVRVIADSDIMQEFLMECDPMSDVEIRVLLPDGAPLSVRTRRSVSTSLFFSMAQRRLQMTREASAACAIFELLDSGFERKVMDAESIHGLYTQNYSSASSSCLLIKKWLFDVERERSLCQKDLVFRQFCFIQATADLNSGRVKSHHKAYQLKAMQSENNVDNFLEMARRLEGYSEVSFPPAQQPGKPGEIVMVVGFESLVLKPHPNTEDLCIRLDWSLIADFRVCEEGNAFSFDYRREEEGKPPKTIKLLTNFAEYMAECFTQISFERQRRQRWMARSNGPAPVSAPRSSDNEDLRRPRPPSTRWIVIN